MKWNVTSYYQLWRSWVSILFGLGGSDCASPLPISPFLSMVALLACSPPKEALGKVILFPIFCSSLALKFFQDSCLEKRL
jgi:hypothetical protein